LITVIAKPGAMIGRMLSKPFPCPGPLVTLAGGGPGLFVDTVAGEWRFSMGRANILPVGIATI